MFWCSIKAWYRKLLDFSRVVLCFSMLRFSPLFTFKALNARASNDICKGIAKARGKCSSFPPNLGREIQRKGRPSDKISMRRKLRAFAFVAILGFVALQVLRWKTFAPEATFWQVKQLIVGLDVNESLQYGAICNSMERFKCSENIFGHLLLRFPKHKQAMANLAIALSQQGQWARSLPYYRDYFRLEGQGYDVMYWYAKSLALTHQEEKALHWFYKSLSFHPNNLECAIELVDHLVGAGRYEEALSVIAAFTDGRPETDPFWLTKIIGIQKFVDHINNKDLEQHRRYQVRIPTIDGKKHFVPVRAGGEDEYEFFLIDRGESFVSISEDFLGQVSEDLLRKTRERRQHSNPLQETKVILPKLQIGPWVIENVEAVVCQSCRPRLGRSILSKLDMSTRKESLTEFIHLTKR